jgi:hypothetical protein
MGMSSAGLPHTATGSFTRPRTRPPTMRSTPLRQTLSA